MGSRGRHEVVAVRHAIAMTTLENRPNTALLVVDVQNGVVEGAHE